MAALGWVGPQWGGLVGSRWEEQAARGLAGRPPDRGVESRSQRCNTLR